MSDVVKRGFRSREADEYCGYPHGTHKQARHHGELYGEEPPAFIKIGKTILYLKEDLDAWLDKFPRFKNTSEASISRNADNA